jgi:hypothetical protein
MFALVAEALPDWASRLGFIVIFAGIGAFVGTGVDYFLPKRHERLGFRELGTIVLGSVGCVLWLVYSL